MARAYQAQTIAARGARLAAVTAVLCLGVADVAMSRPGLQPGAISLPPAAPPAPAPPPAVPVVNLRPDQIALLDHALAAADSQGFSHAAFTPPQMDAELQSRDPDARRAGQTLLVSETLRYAVAVHAGRLTPDAFLDVWGLRPAPFDPAPGFLQAVAQDRLGPWLASLSPPYTGYDALRHGLATYRDIAAHGGWAALDAGPDLKLGASGARVLALRARLAVEDATVSRDRLVDRCSMRRWPWRWRAPRSASAWNRPAWSTSRRSRR